MSKQCPRCNARFRDPAERCPHDGALLEALPDPLIGKILSDRYRLEALIAVGGMGAVYRARHVPRATSRSRSSTSG